MRHVTYRALSILAFCFFASLAVKAEGGASQSLEFFLDFPGVDLWQESDIEIGGWAWGGSEDPIVSVVVEADAWSEQLGYGAERGDVATYLNDPAAVNTGFRARLRLPSSLGSDNSLSIVAYRQSGDKVELKNIRYRPIILS